MVDPHDVSGKPSVGKGQSVIGAFTFMVGRADVNKVRVVAQDDNTLDTKFFKL